MAKRARNSAGATSSGADGGAEAGSISEERLGDFAEDLGRFLGSTQAKASAWLDQRKKLLDNLMKVRDTAALHRAAWRGLVPGADSSARAHCSSGGESGPPRGTTAKKKRTIQPKPARRSGRRSGRAGRANERPRASRPTIRGSAGRQPPRASP